MNCLSRTLLKPTRLRVVGAVLFVGTFGWACGNFQLGKSDSPGIENATLALAISSIPAPFELEINEGDSLVFTAPGPARLAFNVGPTDSSGINLVKEVQDRKAHFEALPAGIYLGNSELGTQIGTAFSSRGSYLSDGVRVEETWIYALHPTSDRLLTLTYRYPETDDSQERVQQLLAVFGEIAALPADDKISES